MGCGAICGQKALPVEQPTAQQPDAKAAMRAQASGLSFMWRGVTTYLAEPCPQLLPPALQGAVRQRRLAEPCPQLLSPALQGAVRQRRHCQLGIVHS